MLAIRGAGSTIVAALAPIVFDECLHVSRDADMPLSAERYLFCAGLLRGKSVAEQTPAEIEEGLNVNLWQITRDCELILSANDTARICVIGSESAYRGSYDGVYATAKKALHEYVEHRRIKPTQQLVCVSPTVIADAGQNARREDEWRVTQRKERHPKKRFLSSSEVARLIHFILYQDDGYLTNVVIRLNGGEHTCL